MPPSGEETSTSGRTSTAAYRCIPPETGHPCGTSTVNACSSGSVNVTYDADGADGLPVNVKLLSTAISVGRSWPNVEAGAPIAYSIPLYPFTAHNTPAADAPPEPWKVIDAAASC